MLAPQWLRRQGPRVDERLALPCFRFVIWLLLTFFLLYSDSVESSGRFAPFWLLALYFASNVALLRAPERALQSLAVQAGVLVFDIAVISAVIYASHGWDSDLYLVYFLVIFMSSLDASLARSFATAGVACAVYAGLALRADVDWTATQFLLRLPFFFLVSASAAFLAGASKRTEQLLEQTSRAREESAERRSALGRLAREIARELGDPIRALSGLAKGLGAAAKADDPRRITAEAIGWEARRCELLLRRFLLLTSDALPSQGLVELNSAAREALENVRASKRWPRALEVNLNLADGLPVVRGERSEIVLALENLLQNAVDAMPRGGTVTVRTRLERAPDGEQRLRVDVSDTGGGIPEFARRRLFEPFFTTKRRFSRQGLGLCFVAAIVERHHGSLDVFTERGRGSRFSLALPGAQ